MQERKRLMWRRGVPRLSLKGWGVAVRPKTLPIGLWPSVLGINLGLVGLVAEEGVLLPVLWEKAPTMLMLITLGLLIQSLANVCNDYFDFRQGADGNKRIGPPRALQQGLLSPRAVKFGMAALTVAIFGLGTLLAIATHWFVLALTALAVAMAFGYTYGRFSMAYLGTGDVVALLMFGPIPCVVAAWAVDSVWSVDAVVAGIGLGSYAVVVLAINNLRDEEGDRLVGKKTLVVRFGTTFGRLEVAVFGFVGALAYPTYQLFDGEWLWLLALLGCIPALSLATKTFAEEPEWNRLLRAAIVAMQAQSLLVTGLLWATN